MRAGSVVLGYACLSLLRPTSCWLTSTIRSIFRSPLSYYGIPLAVCVIPQKSFTVIRVNEREADAVGGVSRIFESARRATPQIGFVGRKYGPRTLAC